jgi:hypothetical protein
MKSQGISPPCLPVHNAGLAAIRQERAIRNNPEFEVEISGLHSRQYLLLLEISVTFFCAVFNGIGWQGSHAADCLARSCTMFRRRGSDERWARGSVYRVLYRTTKVWLCERFDKEQKNDDIP